ncbi:NHL repeat protein [compost metagenome]
MPDPKLESFNEELLIELLVGTDRLTREQIQQARERIVSDAEAGGLPARLAFAADPLSTGLVGVEPFSGSLEDRIALSESAPPLDFSQWPLWSAGTVLILDPAKAGLLGAVTLNPEQSIGLIPTPRGGFLFTGDAPRREESPRLGYLPSPRMAPSAAKSHPLDLLASPGGEFMLVANRGAGTVHVVVANTRQQAGAIALRAAGSPRAIGMAMAPRTAYLTDGLTPRLTVLDVVGLKVQHQPFPTGPLGAIAVTPDASHLLIVFYKANDELGLLTVSTADLRVRHLMNLPGKRLPEAPLEQIAITPDGQLAYLLTSRATGGPTLLVVDLAKRQITSEIPLPSLPLAMAFPPPAEWLPPRPDLETMLIRMGLLAPGEVQRLMENEEVAGPLMDPAIDPTILAQLPERLIRTMGMVPLYRDGQHLNIAMVNPRDAASQQIAQQLAGGLETRFIPISIEDLERFMTERYPVLMESYQTMKNLTPVTRGPGATGAAAAGPAPGGAPAAPPPPPGGPQSGAARGPQPGAAPPPPPPAPGAAAGAPPAPPTPGGGPTPGPRPAGPPAPLPRPGGAPAPRPAANEPAPSPEPAPASAPPAPRLARELPHAVDAGVRAGKVLLPENLKRQLTELSKDRDAVAFKGVNAGGATYLPNGRILATDVGAGKVIEIDPLTQKISWSFGGDPGDRAKFLRAPRWASRLSSGNTLIADTGNHRVIEVTPEGEVVWQYGEPGRAGCAGQGLFKPSAAVRSASGNTLITDSGNHRLVEVSPDGKVVWQYGNAANRLGGGAGSGTGQLAEPSYAYRLANDRVLVTDTGNQRVLELDDMKQIVWHYRPGAVKGGQGVKDPMAAFRVDTGTVILGRYGVVEVDSELKVRWEHHLAGPGTAPLAAVAPATRELTVRIPEAAPAGAPAVEAEAPASTGQELPANFPEAFLVCDRNGGRVLEIDRKMQQIWQFTGMVSGDKQRIVAPHTATRLPNGNTLIADTGNHRVIEVRDQAIVWQFGKRGTAAGDAKHLNQPRSAERTAHHTLVIADFGNGRVLEVSNTQEVVACLNGFKAPAYAAKLATGTFLVVDWGAHQVLECDERGKPLWTYGQAGFSGKGENQLFHPEFAWRLENGHTLIADTQNHRVIEVNAERQLQWQYGGDPMYLGRKGRFGMQFNTPVAAWRLPSGNTMVFHAGNNHLLEIDPELNIVWHFTLSS